MSLPWTGDACFFLGATHTACEDYALAGARDDGQPYAIVADGCSSSPDTDVGSRLLAHAARRSLQLGHGRLDLGWAVRRAAACATLLDLPPTCLDATLLVATVGDGRIRVLVAGDGAVAARRRDSAVETWEVDCDGMPGYPSYALDGDRLSAYLTQAGRRTVVRRLDGRCPERAGADLVPAGPGRWRPGPDGLLWRLELDPDRYDTVVLLSDGCASFVDEAREPVPLAAVAAEVVAVKSGRGAFLRRRLRRFLKRAAARGWSHHDDLAAAAVRDVRAAR